DRGAGVRKESARLDRGGHRHGKDAGVPDPGASQRQARGDLDGHEIAAGAAFPEGCALPAEAFRAEPEGRADEGAREFPVPAEAAADGWATRAEGHRRDGLVRADSRLVEIDGNGGSQRADVPAGFERTVEPAGRSARSVHRAKVRGISALLRDGDAPAGAG